jgi:hypothetical protein
MVSVAFVAVGVLEQRLIERLFEPVWQQFVAVVFAFAALERQSLVSASWAETVKARIAVMAMEQAPQTPAQASLRE